MHRLQADFSLNGSKNQGTGEHLASYANNLQSSSDSDICEARGNCGIEEDDRDDGEEDEDEEEEDDDDDDDDTAYVETMPLEQGDVP